MQALAKNFSMLDPVTGNIITPKINLEHIFLPNIKWLADGSCKISGLHHDYMGLIEQTGLFNMKKIKLQALPNNFYSRMLLYAGDKKVSTFFPQNWTRKEVLQEIIKNLKEENLAWGLEKNKKYRVDFFINQVKIRTYYNPKTNCIDSIFPDYI